MVRRWGGGLVPITGRTSRVISSSAGEPGKSEAVWPSSPRAEEEEIVDVTRFTEARGEGVQHGFVLPGGGFRVDLAPHAEDVALGDAGGIDQRFPGHAIVGIFVIRRHAALVAEGKLDLFPRQIAGQFHEGGVDGPG